MWLKIKSYVFFLEIFWSECCWRKKIGALFFCHDFYFSSIEVVGEWIHPEFQTFGTSPVPRLIAL